MGQRSRYVVSASDDGHLFVWDLESGELLNMLAGAEGDHSVQVRGRGAGGQHAGGEGGGRAGGERFDMLAGAEGDHSVQVRGRGAGWRAA